MSTKRYVIEANENLIKSLMESGVMRLVEAEGEPDAYGYLELSSAGVGELRAQGFSVYVSRAPHELGTMFEVEKNGKEFEVIKKFPKLGGTYHLMIKKQFGSSLSKEAYASLHDAVLAGMGDKPSELAKLKTQIKTSKSPYRNAAMAIVRSLVKNVSKGLSVNEDLLRHAQLLASNDEQDHIKSSRSWALMPTISRNDLVAAVENNASVEAATRWLRRFDNVASKSDDPQDYAKRREFINATKDDILNDSEICFSEDILGFVRQGLLILPDNMLRMVRDMDGEPFGVCDGRFLPFFKKNLKDGWWQVQSGPEHGISMGPVGDSSRTEVTHWGPKPILFKAKKLGFRLED